MRTDGQTDTTKLIVGFFRNFAKAPKKWSAEPGRISQVVGGLQDNFESLRDSESRKE